MRWDSHRKLPAALPHKDAIPCWIVNLCREKNMDIQERPYTQAIKTLKGKIKGLAELQKKTKLCRKTKHVDLELRKKLLEELGIKFPEWANGYVLGRKAEITAHLNLYLELRGKVYRHNEPTDANQEHDYLKTMKGLREELKIA